MKIDLHLHSYDGEDCFSDPEEIVQVAKAKRLDALCITNHDSFIPSEAVARVGKEENFPIFIGVEYSSADGHLLLFGFHDENYVSKKLRPAQEVIDYVTSHGGVIVPSHPYTTSNSRTMGDKVFSLRNIAALETINSKRPS